MAGLRRFAHKVWWYVRQVSGDADYENYLRATRRRASAQSQSACGPEALSAEEFYLERVRRKYNTISRCC